MLCSFILFTVLFGYINAYPSGAPVTTCSTLTPVHSGAEVQRTQSPYQISVEKIGKKIKVTLYSEIGESFRGFMIQARSSRNNQIIDGKFSSTDRVSKAINCFEGKENTLTHSDRKEKREIQTEFLPVAVDEDVIFTATVVKTFFLFWTLNSDSTRISRGQKGALLPGESQQGDSTSMYYHNCFVEKGCFGLPPGCVSSMDCQVLLSYVSTGLKISFTLNAVLQTDTYMAMGLSADEKMGEDLVTACYRKNSVVEPQESYNRGQRNFPSTELSRKYKSSFENGIASCSFSTDYIIEAENAGVLNLQNKTYYVLLAHGPFDTENKRLGYHSSKVSTAQKVNFTSFESINALGTADEIKVHGVYDESSFTRVTKANLFTNVPDEFTIVDEEHFISISTTDSSGCFMITAWIGFASIAILIARHFKTAFHEKKLCNVHVWFAMHRSFMASALVCMIIAFVVIFVYKGGWNFATSNPHASFGTATFILALIQPIMAAFRPSPDHKKRPLFNWMHFIVGNVAYILAIIAMFLAVSLETSGLKESFYVVLSIFVILHVIFHVIFQLHTLKTSRSKAKNEVKMLDMSQPRSNAMQNNATEKSTHVDVFRILLLGLYSIFLVIILLTMYSLIGVA